MPINQPFQPPVIPGKTNRFPFSRGKFLSGEYPSLFMPGQSLGDWQAQPPTDWPRAGTPLRVPKCVFLTSLPPARLWAANFTLLSRWKPFGYFAHHDDPVERDARTQDRAPSLPLGSLLFPGFKGGYEYIGWTLDPQYPEAWNCLRGWRKRAVVRNLIVAEHTRLLREFDEAKSVLESRYPDQVFVQVMEFFPRDPKTAIFTADEHKPKVLDYWSADGKIANTPRHYTQGPPWLLCPHNVQWNDTLKQEEANFFGTNFLHVYTGYQASDGWLLPADGGFVGGDGPDLGNLSLRWHWPRNNYFGWPVGAATVWDYYRWLAHPEDGYQGASFQGALDYMDKALNLVREDGDHLNSVGRLQKLRIGWKNFAGYHVALHEYDPPWETAFAPAPSFKTGVGGSSQPFDRPKLDYPPHDKVYEDQDWVEQEIVLSYGQRQEEAGGDPDQYFPGWRFDETCGYNWFVRYPSLPMYEGWNRTLAEQWDYMKAAVTGLGPQTVRLWERMIAENGLGELGFRYSGGSSTLTAASIVEYVEEHFGLTPPQG